MKTSNNFDNIALLIGLDFYFWVCFYITIIGDDSGDTLYLMKQDEDAQIVYAIDAGGMDVDHLTTVNNNFIEWVKEIDVIDIFDNNDDYHAVYMKGLLDDITDILKIKKCLHLNLSTSEILSTLKKGEEILLVPKIKKCKFDILMRENEYLLEYLKLQ